MTRRLYDEALSFFNPRERNISRDAINEYFRRWYPSKHLNWNWVSPFGKYYKLYDKPLILTPSGIYVIWRGNMFSQNTIYVGEGDIENRLSFQRTILREVYNIRSLNVAWALELDEPTRHGIENYLHDKLNPELSQQSSNEIPIAVNIPWRLI